MIWKMLPFELTILGLVLASLGQARLNQGQNDSFAVALLAAGVALVLLAFRSLADEETSLRRSLRVGWDAQGMLTLLVASLPAWVAGCLLAVRWDSLYTGLVLYACGLGLVCAVCARREGWRRPALNTLRAHGVELTLLGLVLALGLILLVYRLDYYPPPGGISWNDEAQIGKDAYGVIHHGSHPWQFPVSVYTATLAFLTLGPTVFSLRLTFVLLGFATLVVFYLLGREVFRWPVALASTFLFAVSRWHIAFSRLVLPSTPAMLLEVSTFYLLLRGRRTGGMTNYVLAGMAMGLGMHSHASFRIVPFLVLLLLLDQAWSSWRGGHSGDRGPYRPALTRWSSFLASAAVFTLPLGAIIWREPHLAFGERFRSVMPAVFGSGGAAQAEGLAERAGRLVGFFNYQGEAWGAVNLPDLPMLDPLTGVLFVLGFACCLFYLWRKKHLFYVGWFVITLVAGGLLTIDLRSHRFAGLMPVLFIFAGVFIDGAWETFEIAFGHRRRGYFAVLLVSFLVLAGWANYYTFFHRQIDADSVRIEFTREIAAVANYIASLGEGQYVYLFANYPYYSPGMDFAWMAREAPGERGVDVLDVFPSQRGADEDLVYIFVTPYDVQALAGLAAHYYPGAWMETFRGDYGRYTFVAVHVGVEEVRGSRGLLGYYYSGDEVKPVPDMVRRERQLAAYWAGTEPPLAFPFSVEWRGTLEAPEWGSYVLEVEPPGLCQMEVDDSVVQDGERIALVKGGHHLRVTCAGLEDVPSLRLLWTTPQHQREVVPAEFLSPLEEVHGLLVSAFEGPDWGGEPVERSLQPVPSLLSMPTAWQSAFVPELAGELYSLDCQGQLKVEEPGTYRFDVVSWNGSATLLIDGAEVVSVEGERETTVSGQVELGAGWSHVKLRYSYHGGEFSGVEVLWTPPGGEKQVIPVTQLRPAGEAVTGSASQSP
jgi:hypothetical protein